MSLLRWIVSAPFVMLTVLGALCLETWVGVTLWRWFAPWPLPLNLVSAMGLNLAVSVIVRSSTRAKDERTQREKATSLFEYALLVPVSALGVGWVLKTWFL